MAIRIAVDEGGVQQVINEAIKLVDEYIAEFSFRPKSEPGILIIKGAVPRALHSIYFKAVSDYVPIDVVKDAVRRCGESVTYVSGGRGVVGAAAAVGWPEGRDCTYELLTYRNPRFWGMPRLVDAKTVNAFNRMTSGTYLNVDEGGNPLICPGGPDPVLYGVRGDNPRELLKALSIVKVAEPVAGWMLFRTNQHTNDHLLLKDGRHVRPYQSVCVDGLVCEAPRTARGAVMLRLRSGGATLHVASFRESGLHKTLQNLIPGDFIRVCGIVRLWEGVGLVINAELILVRFLVRNSLRRGRCPRCGARMKSLGRGGGMRCPKCGFRSRSSWFEAEPISRACSEGLYLPPPSSFKHLMKPRERYGRERRCVASEPIEGWVG